VNTEIFGDLGIRPRIKSEQLYRTKKPIHFQSTNTLEVTLQSMRLISLLICLTFIACSSKESGTQLIQVLGPESGLKNPFGVAFDDQGSMLIAEYEGGRLWKHNPGKELQRLAADTPFNGMHNLVRTRDGRIYISDTRANLVRMLDENTGDVIIVAGTGEAGYNGDGIPATQAHLNDPISISLSPDDKQLYIADIRNFRVRFIELESGLIYTAAGNGTSAVPKDDSIATESPLLDPRGMAEDSKGNLYILSRKGHALRVVHPDGKIFTVAGTGEPHATNGKALESGLRGPKHLCLDVDDTVVIADAENHLIRRFDPSTKSMTTILDHGPGQTSLNRPHGVWVTPDGTLYICDSYNDRILKLTP
jgi:sugar lactone lactonase YvrE